LTRVAHISSVHQRNDTRIYLKQCSSLAAAGYDVYLIVADGQGDAEIGDVKILDIGLPKGRLQRMLISPGRLLKRALQIKATIYHLHDPELIPIGLRLRSAGKHVVFDSHEDVPQQLLSKPYLGPLSRRVLSSVFSVFERFTCRKFDAIVAATPFIRDKFLKINPRTVNINNYPMQGELSAESDEGEARTKVCYIGGIEAIRGAREIIRAMESVRSGTRLELAGSFSDSALRAEIRQYEGWGQVDECGVVDRAGVRAILGRSLAGLVTFLSAPNHIDAQPNKMFEYMSAGVPVIASHFPLWREIVEGNACGVCVDPSQPHEIAAAIDFFAENPDQVKIMGANGRRAVLDRYNWAMEEAKLLNLYESLS